MITKQSINDILSNIITPNSPLWEYREEVGLSLDALFQHFEGMPSPYASMLRSHYLRRARNRDVSGLFAPWLVIDLLGIDPQKPQIQLLANAWTILHAYFLFMDDLVDNDVLKSRTEMEIAATLCLQRALTILFRLVPSATSSYKQINQYFDELASSVNAEIQQKKSAESTDSTLNFEYPNRMSVIKLWVLFLLYYEQKEALIEQVAAKVDLFNYALQLLDDLKDWEEDWQIGRHSLPLNRTLRRLSQFGLSKKSLCGFKSEEILAALVLTGSFEETLSDISETLENFISKVETKAPVLRAYVNQRICYNKNLEKLVASTRQQLDTIHRVNPRAYSTTADAKAWIHKLRVQMGMLLVAE